MYENSIPPLTFNKFDHSNPTQEKSNIKIIIIAVNTQSAVSRLELPSVTNYSQWGKITFKMNYLETPIRKL